jgi:hypothetical protein
MVRPAVHRQVDPLRNAAFGRELASDANRNYAPNWSRQTLDPYRNCSDDRTVAIRRIWRWAVSIGSFEGSRWRSRRMRAVLWDFNRFTPGKPCQKRVLPKRQSLILIDLWQTLSAKQLVSVFVDLMLGECVSSKTTGRCSRRCFPANGSKWRGISGAVERLRGFPSPDVLLHTLIPHAGRG